MFMYGCSIVRDRNKAKGVKDAVKSLLSSRTFSYLNPDQKQSQFQKSRSFIDGLRQASDAFREKFRINSRGMSRSIWAETSEALADVGHQIVEVSLMLL
jgi:xeroderma pigmentosum group C-complementing protein